MDPKSPVAKELIDVEQAVMVIIDWLQKGKQYSWVEGRFGPARLMNDIMDAVPVPIHLFEGKIPYLSLYKMAEKYRTHKMGGHCDVGIDHIQEEWKKIAKEQVKINRG